MIVYICPTKYLRPDVSPELSQVNMTESMFKNFRLSWLWSRLHLAIISKISCRVLGGYSVCTFSLVTLGFHTPMKHSLPILIRRKVESALISFGRVSFTELSVKYLLSF